MKFRRAGTCIAISAVAIATSAAAAGPRLAPRFSLSAINAVAGDELVARVDRAPPVARRPMRLYLAPREMRPWFVRDSTLA
jgi:hypothetical protein